MRQLESTKGLRISLAYKHFDELDTKAFNYNLKSCHKLSIQNVTWQQIYCELGK